MLSYISELYLNGKTDQQASQAEIFMTWGANWNLDEVLVIKKCDISRSKPGVIKIWFCAKKATSLNGSNIEKIGKP